MLITIMGTLAYLGLAILGGGGFAAFFSHPALTALAITVLVLSGVAVFSGGNLSPGVREDRANRWVVAAFGLIGLLDAYLPAYTDRKEFWDSRWGHHSLAWRRSLRYPAVRCGSGQSLFSASGSADWWPSSPAIRWSRLVSMASSATRAIWVCSSTRWGGRSLFVRGSACFSQRFLYRRS
jgi:hypothetical protein